MLLNDLGVMYLLVVGCGLGIGSWRRYWCVDVGVVG